MISNLNGTVMCIAEEYCFVSNLLFCLQLQSWDPSSFPDGSSLPPMLNVAPTEDPFYNFGAALVTM